MTTPAECATAYFESVASRDADAVAAVFAPDAVLVQPPIPGGAMPGRVIRGRDDIRAFFADLFATMSHVTPEHGPFLVDGDRVAVEIEFVLGEPPLMHTADFFTVRDGLIQRLVVYVTARY